MPWKRLLLTLAWRNWALGFKVTCVTRKPEVHFLASLGHYFLSVQWANVYITKIILLCPVLLGNGLFWAHIKLSLASILDTVLRDKLYFKPMNILQAHVIVTISSSWQKLVAAKCLAEITRQYFSGSWISQSSWVSGFPWQARSVLTTQKSAMLLMDWKETRPSVEVCRKSSDITLV